MINKEIYEKYFVALLAGDRKSCAQIVQMLLDNGIEIKVLYEDLFKQTLYDVGELWEKNKISVAVEHLCTAITESLLNLVYPYLFSQTKISKKVIVACSPGEFHQIGARMVADFFELNSWNSYFLGPNTPTKELVRYIDEVKPDLLVVSASIYFNIPNLVKLVKDISSKFPEIKILIGGQAFRWGGENLFINCKNVEFVPSLSELYDNHINEK